MAKILGVGFFGYWGLDATALRVPGLGVQSAYKVPGPSRTCFYCGGFRHPLVICDCLCAMGFFNAYFLCFFMPVYSFWAESILLFVFWPVFFCGLLRPFLLMVNLN